MDDSGELVITAAPDMVPTVAVTVVDPEAAGLAAASPVLSTVAIPGLVESHAASDVTFATVKFEYVPIASSCTIVPGASAGAPGLMAMETSVNGDEVSILFVVHPGRKAGRSTTLTMINTDRSPFFIAAFSCW